MWLKKKYNREGKFTHVEVIRASRIQRFTSRYIETNRANGVLEIKDGVIFFNTGEGLSKLIYNITKYPGMYCCHCGASFIEGEEAKHHIETVHLSKPSPDKNNPLGYRIDTFFTGEKIGD